MQPHHALVTGSSRGLGIAIARSLLGRDWTVLGIARSQAPAELERVDAYSHQALDLARISEARECTRRWMQALPSSCEHAALILNAAVVEPLAAFPKLSDTDLSLAVSVNLTTPLAMISEALSLGQELRRLTVVLLSSGAASTPYPGWTTYCATKSGLAMAGRVLALELEESPRLAGRDVRVLEYQPNVVATDMQATLRGSDERDFPRKARFVGLHESGELLPPELPAEDLARRVCTPDLPRWSEVRYDPSSDPGCGPPRSQVEGPGGAG